MFLGVLSLDLVCISVLYSCWVQVPCQIHELSIPTWCLASCLMYLLKRILVKSSFSFLPVQFLLFLFWTSSLACSKDLKTSNVTLAVVLFQLWYLILTRPISSWLLGTTRGAVEGFSIIISSHLFKKDFHIEPCGHLWLYFLFLPSLCLFVHAAHSWEPIFPYDTYRGWVSRVAVFSQSWDSLGFWFDLPVERLAVVHLNVIPFPLSSKVLSFVHSHYDVILTILCIHSFCSQPVLILWNNALHHC